MINYLKFILKIMASFYSTSNSNTILKSHLILIMLILNNPVNSSLAVHPLKFSVLEEQPARTIVGDLSELVGQGSNPGGDKVQFHFKYPFKSPYNLFSIVQSNSQLVTTRSINREHICNKDLSKNKNSLLDEVCSVTLDVHLKSSRQDQTVKVLIEIVDINDNQPTFYLPIFTLDVNENSAVGSRFKLPLAVDFDIGINAVQDYLLEEDEELMQNLIFPFSLVYDENEDNNEMELYLKLIHPLDREKISNYQTTVIAKDGGIPQKSGIMTLIIKIIDNNDNIPSFDSETYKVEVSENLAVGTTVMRVYAEDMDQGANGRVEYKLVGSSEAAYGDVFQVEKDSGSILLKSHLDYESVKSYQLVVQASDCGTTSQSSFVGVTINVVDENDNAPQITVSSLALSGNFEVEENFPPHISIAYVSAIDFDEGKNGEVSCSILNAISHDGTTFQNDDSDESIDRQKDEETFILRSSMLNHRTSRSEKNFENINALSFFRLEHYFNSDYKLETTKVFDREKSPYFKLAIECNDQGTEPITSVVTIDIKVIDHNDNPPIFLVEYINLKVSETINVGSLLTVISTRDADEGDNALITYDIEPLSSNQPSSSSGESFAEINDKVQIMAYIKFDKSTGHLFSASPFDFETMPRDLRYRVVATDRGDVRLSSWVPLTITVIDEDDEKPLFDQPHYAFTISESSDPGQIIGAVTASDVDATKEFRQISYQLMPSFDSVSFQVDAKSGMVKTSTRLDRESRDLYHLTILASNPLDPLFSPSSSVNASISVLDSNDNPPIFIFPEKFRLSHVSVPLDSKPASQITKAVATDIDLDENAFIYYSILKIIDQHEGKDSENIFIVDRLTGEVTNTVVLDTEKIYKLLFLAEDGGNPQLSATAELLISVNGSLSGKGAALKSDKDLKSVDGEGGFTWFGLDSKYHLPMLLAMCCGAVGVLSLVLAVAVVVLCRKKRRSERKLKKVVQEKNDSMISSSRNITGSLTCEMSCEEIENYRWPEGAEMEDKWKMDNSVPSFASKKICTSDKCLVRQIDEIKRSRSDRRCPGVGGCESDRSCGEFCGTGGGYTDCESCKESFTEAMDNELCPLKAKSCCQVNQKLSKPDLPGSIHPHPHHPHHLRHPHHHHHHHQTNHQRPMTPQHYLPIHRQQQQCHLQLPLPSKQAHFPLVEQVGRRGKKKTPRSRIRSTQIIRGMEIGDHSLKIEDCSESDMSGSFYCDSGMDSDRVHPATHSS